MDCRPGAYPLLGTRGQIQQILVNLVGNGMDAFAGAGTTFCLRLPLLEAGAQG